MAKKTAAADVEIPEPLNTPEFREAWADWTRHRREIKHALTPTTAQRQLKRLAKEGAESALLRLERSMDNGWQGLWFPDDPDRLVPMGDGGQAPSSDIADRARRLRQERNG